MTIYTIRELIMLARSLCRLVALAKPGDLKELQQSAAEVDDLLRRELVRRDQVEGN